MDEWNEEMDGIIEMMNRMEWMERILFINGIVDSEMNGMNGGKDPTIQKAPKILIKRWRLTLIYGD